MKYKIKLKWVNKQCSYHIVRSQLTSFLMKETLAVKCLMFLRETYSQWYIQIQGRNFQIAFWGIVTGIICDALPDLVAVVQFKKREKHPWRGVTFSKVAGFNKSNTTPWVFFKFLNCINGTKSWKASQILLASEWLCLKMLLPVLSIVIKLFVCS